MASSQLDFAGLFREHFSCVYRYVHYRVKDATLAEDLTAEVFERAYRNREQYDPDRGAFSTWITQIAHNWVNNYLESEAYRQRHEVDADDHLENVPTAEPPPELQVILTEAIQRLLTCLELLAAREKEIVSLRFTAGVRNKEIGELLGIKEHTVSVMLVRILERLRGCQEMP